MNAARRKAWAEQFFTVRVSPALIGALLASVILNLVHSWHQTNEPQAVTRDVDDLRARILQLERECRDR